MPGEWNIFTVSGKEGTQHVCFTSLPPEGTGAAIEEFEFGPSHESQRKLEDLETSNCQAIEDIYYFGHEMWRAITPGKVGAAWNAARVAYGRPELVRIGLRLPAELQNHPWEALCDKDGGDQAFAATDKFCLARLPQDDNIEFPKLPETPDIHVLIIATSKHVSNAAAEITLITEALARRGVKPVVLRENVTADLVREALAQQEVWHVIHYIGHGRVADKQTELMLYAEDNGQPAWYRAEIFGSWLDRVDTRLVVLNCCEGTGSPDRLDSLNGAGEVLQKKGIPAVVAMQYLISNPMAQHFSRGFYAALLHGRQPGRVDAAMGAARAVLSSNQHTDYRAFITPVLYLAPGHEQVFQVPKSMPLPRPVDRLELPPVIAPPVLPTELANAVRDGRCVMVVGAGILSLLTTRQALPALPDALGLTELLAGRTNKPYPSQVHLNFCRQAPEWLNDLVQPRVCEHYMFGGPDGYAELLQAVQTAFRAFEPPTLIQQLANLRAPALFYTYFDGLIDRCHQNGRSSFTKVIRRLGVQSELALTGDARERVLVLPCGSVEQEDSLVLLERDHDKLTKHILDMPQLLTDVARRPAPNGKRTCVLFMGISPCDSIARLLAQKLLDTDMKRRHGKTFFAWQTPDEAEQAYWGQYAVEWLQNMELQALLPALCNLQANKEVTL